MIGRPAASQRRPSFQARPIVLVATCHEGPSGGGQAAMRSSAPFSPAWRAAEEIYSVKLYSCAIRNPQAAKRRFLSKLLNLSTPRLFNDFSPQLLLVGAATTMHGLAAALSRRPPRRG